MPTDRTVPTGPWFEDDTQDTNNQSNQGTPKTGRDGEVKPPK